jgi:serine phosphatase RsbU (regulator of sigma subunit)/predicted ester cyclase
MVSTRRGETRVDEEEKEQAPVSSKAEEKNKALVRRFFQAQGKGELETIDELLAPDFVDHNVETPIDELVVPGSIDHRVALTQDPGREAYMQSVVEDLATHSNIRYIVDEQLADGNKIISRIRIRSIHDRAEFQGLTPNYKVAEETAIVIHRIVGGKIAEEWSEGSSVAYGTQRLLEQEIRERERVEQEMRVARSIQQASLPKEVPKLEGWQITPFYQPARKVGGDFYDFFELDEERLGVVVGDATGKGVPAALVAEATSNMLRALAQGLGSPSAGEVLERINETLLARMPTNMFVTCFYAILDPKSASLSYANAGHDLPYLYRSSEAEELRARGMPLGLMPAMGYEQKEVVLERGDSALFYTDGLVEARDPKGEMFGFPRLQALVAEHAEGEPLGEFLMEELYTFVGAGWEQEDDITLLTLRRTPSRS